jgi:hypothetical protein
MLKWKKGVRKKAKQLTALFKSLATGRKLESRYKKTEWVGRTEPKQRKLSDMESVNIDWKLAMKELTYQTISIASRKEHFL